MILDIDATNGSLRLAPQATDMPDFTTAGLFQDNLDQALSGGFVSARKGVEAGQGPGTNGRLEISAAEVAPKTMVAKTIDGHQARATVTRNRSVEAIVDWEGVAGAPPSSHRTDLSPDRMPRAPTSDNRNQAVSEVGGSLAIPTKELRAAATEFIAHDGLEARPASDMRYQGHNVQAEFPDQDWSVSGLAVARAPDGSFILTLYVDPREASAVSSQLDDLKSRLDFKRLTVGDIKLAVGSIRNDLGDDW